MYQRGDIVLVPFPFTDHHSTKKRPALIISNDLVNAYSDVIVVMITSQHKADFFEIEIDTEDAYPTLPKRSYVRCHKIAIIDSRTFIAKISKASSKLLASVESKIGTLICEEQESGFVPPSVL